MLENKRKSFSSTERIKIAVADSQMLTREGVVSVLRTNGVFEEIFSIEMKDELFELLKDNPPSILIIDPWLLKGFQFYHFSELTSIYPVTNILVLTANRNKDYIRSILSTGVDHFILKTCTQEELFKALDAIKENEKYLSVEIIKILTKGKFLIDSHVDNHFHLTKKEIEIIRMIAQGLTTKEIARDSCTSVHTVNTHRKNILKKLGLNNTSELVMYAIKVGIIDTTEYYI